MTKTTSWTGIAAAYLALLDSDIDTDKRPEKAPEKITFQWKCDFPVQCEIREIRCNGRIYEVRNGFIIYN